MIARHPAALILGFSLLAASSCSSQSRQQGVPRTQSIISSSKPPQAKAGSAVCVGDCFFIALNDQAPGCYFGIIPEMKSYAAPPAGMRYGRTHQKMARHSRKSRQSFALRVSNLASNCTQ